MSPVYRDIETFENCAAFELPAKRPLSLDPDPHRPDRAAAAVEGAAPAQTEVMIDYH